VVSNNEVELYEIRVDTLYHLGYEDDEYIVTKIELNGSVRWDVESVTYGGITNSCRLGKKLINFIKNNGKQATVTN
jgi:hypothetical protein